MRFQHYPLDLCAVLSPDYTIEPRLLAASLEGPLLRLKDHLLRSSPQS